MPRTSGRARRAPALVRAAQEAEAEAERVERLLDACEWGDVGAVTRLLDEGVDVNATDDKKQTGLIFATAYGRLDVVNLLLSRGADVTVKDCSFKGTALHFACFNDSMDICVALAANGADLTARNKFKKTPLDVVGGSRVGDQELSMQEKESRRELLLQAHAEFALKQKRARNWAERRDFVLFLSGSGFAVPNGGALIGPRLPRGDARLSQPLGSVPRDWQYVCHCVFGYSTGRGEAAARRKGAAASIAEIVASFL